ncbi:MAG TPA: hypothetical protein VG650_08105 [Mycobacteriales bacterium]|nr:hypothetical protein [Mycobacteriales bacterium]
MTSGGWTARYADLAGKAAVLAGTSSVLGEVARVLADNGVMAALVVNDRELVDAATGYAAEIGVASIGLVADPAERGTWERVSAHIEQRLGPIDIAVAIAPPEVRREIVTALLPDMAARRRGVIVEAGASVEPLPMPTGLRHRAVSGAAAVDARDLAAAIALCVSDVLSATAVDIRLGVSD